MYWTRGRYPASPPKFAGTKQHRQAYKEVVFTQHDTVVIGSKTINANLNFAPANDNYGSPALAVAI